MVWLNRILVLLCLCPVLALAQEDEDDTPVFHTPSKHEIRQSGDSLLKYYLGDMYNYCTYKKKGYYTYKDTNTGITHYTMLSKHKYVPGKLINAFLSYYLNYPYPDCAAYNKITGTIYLKMDSNLAAAEKPDLRFIPDFVWNNENCRLITKEKAISLALDLGFKEGKKPPKAEIEYDIKSKQFFWFISNRIPKDSTIQKKFVIQTMQINAFTRKKVTYSKAPKAPPPQH
jgi:hypothetical protein